MGARHNPYFRKLLVGFDCSPQAERAVEAAMELAACLDAEVLVFAMASPPVPATIVEVHATFDDARDRYTAALEKLVQTASEHGVEMKTEIAVGHPAEQIIHRADIGGIDIVVLGRRRSRRLSNLVRGSISEPVMKHVHCPVMMVA
jgi:nucleotide-binding universal stress UspA family protein